MEVSGLVPCSITSQPASGKVLQELVVKYRLLHPDQAGGREFESSGVVFHHS
jgi:hypothetical protein